MKNLKLVLIMFVLAATSVAFGTISFEIKNNDCGCGCGKKSEDTSKSDITPKPKEGLTDGGDDDDSAYCLTRIGR